MKIENARLHINLLVSIPLLRRAIEIADITDDQNLA